MAGKLIVDTIDTDNAFITLNVQQSLIATMNVSGIYSNTGVKMIGANGTVSNTAITGLVTASQIANVANTQLTGTITGSQISSNTLSNTVFQTGSVENYMNAQGLGFGMRNRIINGAMVIDQRNAGASVTVNSSTATYPVDRFAGRGVSSAGVFTAQQSSTAPTGFNNSVVCTVTTSATPASTDAYLFRQNIEGFNVADLGFGAAGASTVTLSFWVRSSLTGTFGGAIQNDAFNRFYPFSYTISSANTWEQKSVTIAGDTSGTWLKTNGNGMTVSFSLGAGSSRVNTAGAWTSSTSEGATGQTNLISTNGATFYITGVQLEKGSTATSFDYRPYGTELALCQRYYYKYSVTGSDQSFGSGYNYGTTNFIFNTKFPVSMRTAPSALEQTGTAGDYKVLYLSSTAVCTSVPTFSSANVNSADSFWTVAAVLTAGQGALPRSSNANAFHAWSTEL